VLLAKTLRSSTFKIALIAIFTFGVIISAIFTYVYLSTASYVRDRSDRMIVTEQAVLRDAYRRSGRDGLIALVRQRSADPGFAGHVYLLTDPSPAILAGNLTSWPPVDDTGGWIEFRAREPLPAGATAPLLRAMIETLPGGDRLLVGRDISDLDSFTARIKTAVISGAALIFVLAGVVSILVTRRTVGRIESINAATRAIMQSGLDQRIPLRGSHDEWDRVAENLNLMLDRIETLMGEVKQVSDNVATSEPR
jgi:HAMP domain-containing protein